MAEFVPTRRCIHTWRRFWKLNCSCRQRPPHPLTLVSLAIRNRSAQDPRRRLLRSHRLSKFVVVFFLFFSAFLCTLPLKLLPLFSFLQQTSSHDPDILQIDHSNTAMYTSGSTLPSRGGAGMDMYGSTVREVNRDTYGGMSNMSLNVRAL